MEAGEEFNYLSPDMTRPILHTLVERGCMEVLSAISRQEGEWGLDLTAEDKDGKTPLQLLCTAFPRAAMTPILDAFVYRIMRPHRRTAVNWGQENKEGMDGFFARQRRMGC